MQDVHAMFFTACYSEDKGIEGFYDALVDHAQNMAVYLDVYQIVKMFLHSIPAYICEHMIKDGLSPEVNTIDNFVAEAKKHEAAKKTLDYYNKMIQQSNPAQKALNAHEPSKPTLKKVGMTFICKPHPRGNPKDVSKNQWLFIKPKEPYHKGAPIAHHPRFHNNVKPPHTGHPGSNPQAKSLRCF